MDPVLGAWLIITTQLRHLHFQANPAAEEHEHKKHARCFFFFAMLSFHESSSMPAIAPRHGDSWFSLGAAVQVYCRENPEMNAKYGILYQASPLLLNLVASAHIPASASTPVALYLSMNPYRARIKSKRQKRDG